MVTKSWGGPYLRRILLPKSNKGRIDFPGANFWLVTIVILLLPSVLFFAGATLAGIPQLKLPLDRSFLQTVTAIIFAFTLIVTYAIAVLDFVDLEPTQILEDYLQGRQASDLEKEVDTLRETHGKEDD